MNVLSLFDGMSCGRIALERAGIKVDNYYASEIDKYAIQIAKKNYPDTIHIGNVVDVKANDLPKIDLLIGGSPCQSFSSFGNGTGFEGKSGLFWEFVRILRESNPKYFLLENVNMKKEWQDIISRELGVTPISFNSNLVSAQNRDRLYWTNINFSLPENKNISFKDILEDNPFRSIPKCFYTNWGNKPRIDKGLNWVLNNKANCLKPNLILYLF
jgi:DNA (cytosine-5)-methyltransferase 3A